MKRASTDTTAIVYAYGCLEPVSGMEHAIAEVERQRAMWDLLVLSDRAAERSLEDAARTDHEIDRLICGIRMLDDAIRCAVAERRTARAAARSKVDTPEIDARIAAHAAERKALRAGLRPLLKTWRKNNKPVIDGIEAERRAAEKRIRQQSGLYWGNYNRVLDDFAAGRKVAKQRGGRMRLSDPRRRDGCLTVQIQRTKSGLGAAMSELMDATYAQLQIAMPSHAAYDRETPRGARRRLCRSLLDIRIDAAGNRLLIPLVLHRLPPPGSRIKSAQLTWRPEGEGMRYQLALTCVAPKATPVHPGYCAVGLDLGWRLQPDGGLLVATTWNGTASQRFTLPKDWMSGMDQVERLASHIDDDTLNLASRWHGEVATLPDDLRLPLMGWRPKRGAGHVDTAALHDAIAARIAATPDGARCELPDGFRHWYDRYRHLGIWRDNLRAKLQRRRREIYRHIAREIAGYALIGLEEIDLSELARTAKRAPETGDNPLHAPARAQRQRACVHLLRQEILHQAAKHGSEVARITGPSTQHCHHCGDVSAPQDRSARIWTCANGHVWDQDINAAVNLYQAAVGDASGPVTRVAA